MNFGKKKKKKEKKKKRKEKRNIEVSKIFNFGNLKKSQMCKRGVWLRKNFNCMSCVWANGSLNELQF